METIPAPPHLVHAYRPVRTANWIQCAFNVNCLNRFQSGLIQFDCVRTGFTIRTDVNPENKIQVWPCLVHDSYDVNEEDGSMQLRSQIPNNAFVSTFSRPVAILTTEVCA